MFSAEWSHRKSVMSARPHPCPRTEIPIPNRDQERVNRRPGLGDTNALRFRRDFGAMTTKAVTARETREFSRRCELLFPLLGERIKGEGEPEKLILFIR